MDKDNILSLVSDFTDITIYEIDTLGDINKVLINTMEGYDPKAEQNIYDFFIREDRKRLKSMIDSGEDQFRRSFLFKSKYYLDCCVNIESKTISGKTYIALSFVQSDHEKEVVYEQKLEKMAEIAQLDPMTKLLNRYGYWKRVQSILNCGDPERKIGILLVDMDGLKKINDEKGHKTGDIAIKQISNLISKSIRTRDIAVRYGGDEFVIVVEELSGSKSTAYGLGLRLVKDINRNKKKFLTTLSVGVHVVKVGQFEKYLSKEEQLKKLWDREVEEADKMAYKAKTGGRNQVVFSDKVKA